MFVVLNHQSRALSCSLGENDEYEAENGGASRCVISEIHFTSDQSVLDILNNAGHMPLPPYIDRPDEDADKERYQTVYNEKLVQLLRQQLAFILMTS